jgi:hypothetical protein
MTPGFGSKNWDMGNDYLTEFGALIGFFTGALPS